MNAPGHELAMAGLYPVRCFLLGREVEEEVDDEDDVVDDEGFCGRDDEEEIDDEDDVEDEEEAGGKNQLMSGRADR